MARFKRLVKIQAALAATVVSAVVFSPATPAYATNIVGGGACALDSHPLFGKHQYFALINVVSGQAQPLCFANAGTIILNPPVRAKGFRSGDNAGVFYYTDSAHKAHIQNFGKKEGTMNLGDIKVARLTIN
jgi:hypothetical protein